MRIGAVVYVYDSSNIQVTNVSGSICEEIVVFNRVENSIINGISVNNSQVKYVVFINYGNNIEINNIEALNINDYTIKIFNSNNTIIEYLKVTGNGVYIRNAIDMVMNNLNITHSYNAGNSAIAIYNTINTTIMNSIVNGFGTIKPSPSNRNIAIYFEECFNFTLSNFTTNNVIAFKDTDKIQIMNVNVYWIYGEDSSNINLTNSIVTGYTEFDEYSENVNIINSQLTRVAIIKGWGEINILNSNITANYNYDSIAIYFGDTYNQPEKDPWRIFYSPCEIYIKNINVNGDIFIEYAKSIEIHNMDVNSSKYGLTIINTKAKIFNVNINGHGSFNYYSEYPSTYENIEIDNVKVNGKPVLLIKNENNIEISSNDIEIILIVKSNNITIRNQLIQNQSYPISIVSSNNIKLINNTIRNISGYYTSEDYCSRAILIKNCNNVTLTNLNINEIDGIGIEITSNNTFINKLNIYDENEIIDALRVESSFGFKLHNINITLNDAETIVYLGFSRYVWINNINVRCNYTDDGIYIYGCRYTSMDNSNIKIEECDGGIYVGSSYGFKLMNSIINTRISWWYDIGISYGTKCVYIMNNIFSSTNPSSLGRVRISTADFIVVNNTISRKDLKVSGGEGYLALLGNKIERGKYTLYFSYLKSKSKVIATWNNILNSSYYAIYVYRGYGNVTMYLNNFIDHEWYLYKYWSDINFTFNSPFNLTYIYNGNEYHGYLGNYWDMADIADSNGNGIGDQAYLINGGEHDYYPLNRTIKNYVVPVSFNVTPLTGELNTTINRRVYFNFTLTNNGTNPDIYVLYTDLGDLNATMVKLNPGESKPIRIGFTPFIAGDYIANITIISVNDPSKIVTIKAKIKAVKVIEKVTLKLDLVKGWNLITVPLELTDNSVEAVFDNLGVPFYIYTWNAEGKHYVSPNVIEPGKGYWIFVPKPATLTVTGKPISDLTLNLKKGWNLIGGVTEDSTFTLVSGNVLSIVYAWDAINKRYETNTILESCRGYWILAIEDSVIQVRK